MSEIRLSKLMAQCGMCSRREADRYIEQGLVLVDGVVVNTLGTKIREDQKIELTDRAQKQQIALATVLLNKPMGYVSGLPEDGYESAVMLITKENRQNVWDATPSRRGLAPAGRLDVDSMGLIVFTQDGRVARTLVGENSDIEKEYLVWARGEINETVLQKLRHGLTLDDKPLKPAQIDHITGSQMRFVLKEGKKRQIRRMCQLVGLHVSRLIRVRIGNVALSDLESGRWRLLQPEETF